MSSEAKHDAKFLGLYLTIKELDGDFNMTFTSYSEGNENRILCECILSLPRLKMVFQSDGESESEALRHMCEKLKPIVDQISIEYEAYLLGQIILKTKI